MAISRPEDLDHALRSGKLGALYLFDGPEEWLKQRAVGRIVKKLVPAEAADFNLERFDGQSCRGGEIASSAQSLPWMSERRVIVVQSADGLAVADARIVADALANLPPTTCLIFLYEGKANLREEIPAHVSSHGATVTFWPPFPNQMPAWVASEAKLRGKTMTPDAAMALSDACADLQEISNELDKLALFVGKKTMIDRGDLTAHGLPDEAGDFKDLEEALWTRNLGAALRQGQLLSEMGIRTEAVIPVVQRVLRTLLLGHLYVAEKKWSVADALTALRIKARAQQANFTTGLKAYDSTAVRRGFKTLVRTDYDVKTGVLPSEIALSLMLVDVMGGKKEAASGFGHR